MKIWKNTYLVIMRDDKSPTDYFLNRDECVPVSYLAYRLREWRNKYYESQRKLNEFDKHKRAQKSDDALIVENCELVRHIAQLQNEIVRLSSKTT